ncbi:rhomboid family intramembrane serine protease [Spirosoma montaniterrae]|uniref:Rhomboid family intramembrane serine protease n=1 Tax=Spirosoma montaniterrae TaxID=1178516 RepID=A0A1P9X1Q5_9BACT|nr:rhomboid family intramembrane serine protease [Spirosoma montaniterrae]AQG81559.1 rhomboid family intramembrane serine protease [Spirosoma montaniterrae]
MFALTPVVRALLLLNVVAFIFTNDQVIEQFGLHSFLSDLFNPIQLLTHMFLHGGFGHIFSNMLGLIVFGPMLEQFWGAQRFTFFYFFTGIGAALLFSGINYYEMRDVYEAVQAYRANPTPDAFIGFFTQHANSLYDRVTDFINQYEAQPNSQRLVDGSVQIINRYYLNQVDQPMVGASGAIFGVIMGFGLLFPNTELFLLFPPIPIKAKYLVIFYGAYELYSGVYRAQSDNVAHFAHIGGMLFAFILVKYWGSQRKTFY